MEFFEAIIYIIGTGMLGALVGIIVGVILASEQILQLQNKIDRLEKEKEEARNLAPQFIEISDSGVGQSIDFPTTQKIY